MSATVSLSARGHTIALHTDSNGIWNCPKYPVGTTVSVSIRKSGYRPLDYSLIVAGEGKSALRTTEEDQVVLAEGIQDTELLPEVVSPLSDRFQPNVRVRVSNTGVGLRARAPLYDSPPVAVMADGQLGTVLGGPISHNGYQWWLIDYDNLSGLAWSAEGEPATPGIYYLEEVSIPTQPVLTVSPASQSVGAGASLASFAVTNTGSGTMNWSASSNASWLHIVSGTNGINAGTIQCSCEENQGSSQRVGTIQITSAGASGSPRNVTVTQAGTAPPPQDPPMIVVTYGSRQGPEIIIGDFTPSAADGTDWGNIPIRDDVAPAYRHYVIQNYGAGMLYLTGSPRVQISGSPDFSIYEQPPDSAIDPWDGSTNGATGFSVQFDPSGSPGLKQAVISITSNDANHSPYQFAIQGVGVLPVLQIGSKVNGGIAEGVPVVVNPPDATGKASGVTPFSVSYSPGTQVTVSVPVQTPASDVFTEWSNYRQGEVPNGTSITVTVEYDREVFANYETRIRSLNVMSAGADSVAVSAQPADRNGETMGATGFSLSYNNGTYVTLTAPLTADGKAFIDWTGVDGQDGSTGYVTMDNNKTVTANYLDPAALSVAEIFPSSGPLVGDTPAIITGTNFAEPMTVTFGDVGAADVTVLDSHNLAVTVPAGAFPGNVEVAVSTSGATATVPGGFTYIGGAYDTRVLRPPSAATSYHFGTFGLESIQDLDGDGVGDVIVTDNNASVDGAPSSAGCAYVYSGGTGALMYVMRSPCEMESGRFGVCAAAVPDVDGDGLPDIAIGAAYETSGTSPLSAGRVHLFSGRTGGHLRTLVSPNEVQSGNFGYSVSGLEDVDGDGRGDLVVGAPYEDLNVAPARRGCVYVVSGATGTCIRTVYSPNPAKWGFFGFSVSGTPDVNNDGKWDFLVGTTLSSADPHAYVFSGANATLLRTVTFSGRESGYYVGSSVSWTPDINQDGVPDLLIGDPDGNVQQGRVYVVSGVDGSAIRTLSSPNQQNSGFFGRTMSAITDVNGDLVPDVIVGASSEYSGASPFLAGRAHLFSGLTGALLKTFTSPMEVAGGAFGSDVAALDDLNGDGVSEVAIATGSELRVYIFALEYDIVGPTGSIMINGDAVATNDVAALLSLTWDDGIGSGVTRMRFSNDGATWSPWEPLLISRPYALPGADGYKTVRVQYLDRSGNRSVIYSDYIKLDTVSPTGSIVINNNRSATNNTAVALKLTWSDPNGSGVTRMRFSNDGATWTPWTPLKTSPAYVLPGGDGYKTVRVQYRDAAGNSSIVYRDYIRLDTTPPTGSILINGGASSTKSRSVALSLGWSDGNGAGVSRMRFSIDGATWSGWEPLAATKNYLLPSAPGYYTVRVTYRDGADNISERFSDYIRLDVP